jgi:hypothetical protein
MGKKKIPEKSWKKCLWCGTEYAPKGDRCLMKAHKSVDRLLNFISKECGKGTARRLCYQLEIEWEGK